MKKLNKIVLLFSFLALSLFPFSSMSQEKTKPFKISPSLIDYSRLDITSRDLKAVYPSYNINADSTSINGFNKGDSVSFEFDKNKKLKLSEKYYGSSNNLKQKMHIIRDKKNRIICINSEKFDLPIPDSIFEIFYPLNLEKSKNLDESNTVISNYSYDRKDRIKSLKLLDNLNKTHIKIKLKYDKSGRLLEEKKWDLDLEEITQINYIYSPNDLFKIVKENENILKFKYNQKASIWEFCKD